MKIIIKNSSLVFLCIFTTSMHYTTRGETQKTLSNSLWTAIQNKIFLPVTTLNKLSFGYQDAQNKYVRPLNLFLENYGLTNVIIKKLNPSSMLPESLTPQNQALYANPSGIWLDEEKLDEMNETELTFELALVATTYAHIDVKEHFMNGILYITPYVVRGLLNYYIYQMSYPALTQIQESTSFTEGFTKGRSAGTQLLATCLFGIPLSNHYAYSLSSDLTRHLLEKKYTQQDRFLLEKTTHMLYKYNYEWLVKQYVELLKQRLSTYTSNTSATKKWLTLVTILKDIQDHMPLRTNKTKSP